ncbi:uncharacterized protein B0P05DRAFT_225813 [Gilbertella persicaria]|uniref:uncharacterized protein n=1 Tax=Gilbertella persicaria TaxID=101096 RepID=UPI0022204453|nr:uncharacterized protein B0P05DRAFT_525886 [Gilbertella persicaria]XP_051438830.1 uncharacterized protein B0P05DRAFT_225813 [Gilbertella persicaria]KAI8092348.1 hypothetical protein B0P05DRAFT_525886 [Gilbertella persicaria]KAI8092370.1 hypothetical protein B0P05DRAFT_225813 [Gilbertella persicaria]
MLYTTRFDEKSLLSFIKWCNTKKVLYMNQEQERKALKDQNGSKVRYRVLWTLKDEYLNGIAYQSRSICQSTRHTSRTSRKTTSQLL